MIPSPHHLGGVTVVERARRRRRSAARGAGLEGTPPCVAADYTASDARSVHVIALDDEPAAAGAVRPPSSPGALSSSSAALDAKPLLATVPIDLGDAWVRALAAALAPRALPPPPLSSALATDA